MARTLRDIVTGLFINEIRNQVVTDVFTESIGQRVFILVPQFPYMLIGVILDVANDFVLIDVETTNIPELDGEKFRVHLHDIEVFYIEDEAGEIPEIFS